MLHFKEGWISVEASNERRMLKTTTNTHTQDSTHFLPWMCSHTHKLDQPLIPTGSHTKAEPRRKETA